MAKQWLILLSAFALTSAKADDLFDFSNNLATDIGPLIVLFGEAMTRQYLSESTTFLDYFIFAMAPIGILTAIVSVIRVCGHSSLRAFIGRSQEGDGTVEAELCTSTSRDVCELFNRGGITRALGRPSILELVYDPQVDKECDSQGAEQAGLFLFRNYLKHTPAWERVPSSSEIGDDFSPYPNLSLNFGIKKQPDWLFYLIAVLGFIFQAGVLAMAAVGVWVLHWNLNDSGTAAPRKYAPAMFIAGTVLMCVGMWSCAALIGQTTRELRYKHNDQSPQSRLLWLQPGPQVIGDQTFDPFAYFEDSDDPLRIWTSSKKELNERRLKTFEVCTFFAVSAVLVGYIMQFIGLRGMKAWVSLAQLGITVTMSFLRGILRAQRLNRGDNKLGKIPDRVSGHELDWLSFEINKEPRQPRVYWCVTGQYDKAEEMPDREIQQTRDKSKSSIRSPTEDTSRISCDQLLRIRVRLAHLTGHNPFSKIDESESQVWKEESIKVRAKAGQLSLAICLAAEKLFQKSRKKDDIVLRIQGTSSVGLERTTPQLLSLTLRPPSESSQTGWIIDSAQVEAILGLWLWTLIVDERLEIEEDSPRHIPLAEKIPCFRIISAGFDDDSWSSEVDIQGEMDLWLGTRAVKLSETGLAFDKMSNYGLDTIWTSRISEKWQAKEADVDKVRVERPDLQRRARYSGWSPIHKALQSAPITRGRVALARLPSHQEDGQIELRIQTIRLKSTRLPLLDLCAQELFTAFMMSLAGLLTIEKATIVENDGIVRLESSTVSIFGNAFVDSHLGDFTDALLCIIPAIKSYMPSLELDELLSAITSTVDRYRLNSEWERAETLMRWACTTYT